MKTMSLFGKADEADGLPVSKEFLESLYRKLRYNAEHYMAMFGKFPGADAVFSWLYRYGCESQEGFTREQADCLASLSTEDKKQIADVLVKAFCGEIFLVPEEERWNEILQKDGMRLADVPLSVRTIPLNLTAVRQNGMALQYCDINEYLIREAALARNGLAFQFLGRKRTTQTYGLDDSDKYYYLRTLALSQNGLALEFMDEQEVSECYLAIRQNPESAKFVTNEEVLAACYGDLDYLVNHLDGIIDMILVCRR